MSFYLELSKEEENIEKEEMIINEIKVLENKKDKLLDLAFRWLFKQRRITDKESIYWKRNF